MSLRKGNVIVSQKREQFAGWGLYDNSAICLTCGHEHLIPKAEQINDQPWLDWQTKHLGHETFIIPHRLRSALSERSSLRRNADAKIAYAASSEYTITLSGLATSSTLVAGRESNSVSNAAPKYIDELVAGKCSVGSVAVTASTYIEVHAVGALNDTPEFPDVFDGVDSAETITSAGIKGAICRPIGIMLVDATTAERVYAFAPTGIRQMFGDGLPPAHVIFVTHNTGQNMAGGSPTQSIYHTPIYATIS